MQHPSCFKVKLLMNPSLVIIKHFNCDQDEHAGEDTDKINTKLLKPFISRKKWQVSALAQAWYLSSYCFILLLVSLYITLTTFSSCLKTNPIV